MNKNLYFVWFTLLFIGIKCSAQYNANLLDTSKRWSTIDQYTAGGGFPYSFFNKFSGDTLIGDLPYLKVWTCYNEFMTDWELTGFIRQDGLRVYLRNLSNDEGLIYDFNVQAGDTVHLENHLSWWSGWNVDAVITGIDSIYIDPAGEFRKCFYLKAVNGPPQFTETWIEGIGSDAGVLFSGFKVMGVTGTQFELLCYYEGQYLFYRNPGFSVCYYPMVGIAKPDATYLQVQVVPNPVRDVALIEMLGAYTPGLTVVIRDSRGNTIRTVFADGPGRIAILGADAPPGMYFFTVTSPGKIIASGKFIKY